MKIGIIGLGKMGANMALNLAEHKHKIVAYNRSPEITKRLSKQNKSIIPTYSLEELITQLPKQKIIWIMITAGKPVDDTIKDLIPFLKKGDIIIDGGNSYYQDSIKRYNQLKKKQIHFLDAGMSGGVSGARHGAAIMVGGNKKIFQRIEPVFKDLCVKNGYGYMGKAGAGHFVKAVHNAIEYGMIGAIAEGMEILNKEKNKFKTDLDAVVKVYSNGTIIESKLMKWLEEGMKNKKYFNSISGKVPKGFTEDEMKKIEQISEMPILHQAHLTRSRSRKKPSFAGKIISIIRNKFGGHEVFRK